MRYLLSIDQGTTSSRAVIFDESAKAIGSAQQEFPQHFPADGWVEHDPQEIWQSVLATCKKAIAEAGIDASQVVSCGITNQRETTLVWDRSTGETIYPAIVWQDRRTAARCQQMSQDAELVDYIQQNTGLLLDPYFSASKIAWILDHVAGARQRAERGELAFGTIDSYLLWQLTAGRSHRTDATNAARTSLFNINDQCWDSYLLEQFNIPLSLMPEVLDCADEFGCIDGALLGAEIPIQGIAGDQQAALIGQACFEPGMAKSTYGTGCFMILNTGKQAIFSDNRLLTTVAYRLNGEVCYALEGSIFMAGATIQWLRDGLQFMQSAADSEALAQAAQLNSRVFLVPAFTGLGAPYWDPDARGAILGLTRDTGINEIVAAGLKAVCFQTKDLQKAMQLDGQRASTLRVDGGMVANRWLMQFLADILGAEVQVPVYAETTVLGAAYLAGLQAGVFDNLEQLKQAWQCAEEYCPRWSKTERDASYQAWQQAVQRIRSTT